MAFLQNKQKTALGAAVLLLVFAAVKVAAVYWFSQQQGHIETVSGCMPRQGCALPDGSVVRFHAAVRQPFEIAVDGVPDGVDKVSVTFSMEGMDMGFNRFDLHRQNGGTRFAREIRLPVCTVNRSDYLADFTIGSRTYRIAFEAQP